MTDITYQDKRDARQWADEISGYPTLNKIARAAVNYILATVDAPAPTLAEELRDRADLLDNGGPAWHTPHALRAIADRVDQMEHDLTESRADVERLTAERVTDPSPTLNDGSMTRPATVAREENVYPDLPDPADVKPREAWIVNIDGVEIVPGFKASVGWICYRFFGGTTKAIGDEHITLVTRLVPAPRVITNPDELDTLAEETVIRDWWGLVSEKQDNGGWMDTNATLYDSARIASRTPVTVLWEPEA